MHVTYNTNEATTSSQQTKTKKLSIDMTNGSTIVKSKQNQRVQPLKSNQNQIKCSAILSTKTFEASPFD